MRLALMILLLAILSIIWTAGGDPRALVLGFLAFVVIGGVVALATSARRCGSR